MVEGSKNVDTGPGQKAEDLGPFVQQNLKVGQCHISKHFSTQEIASEVLHVLKLDPQSH